MNTFLKTALAIFNTLKNKLIALLVLFVLIIVYHKLPVDQPVPFAELLYAIILISSVTILAPIMRLLVFPEVAGYAEGGKLTADLDSGKFTPWQAHYILATIICYTVSLLCVSSLLSR